MKTTNQLKHTIVSKTSDGDSLFIKISLDDDCKNGHIDFSLTAIIYEANKRHIDKNILSCGMLHDEILQVRPELKMFADLHLSDAKGCPLYTIENGYYWLKSNKEVALSYLRITEEEYSVLSIGNKMNFIVKLGELGIVSRWKSEAKIAIKKLEEMTGLKFEDNSIKSNLD